MSELLISILDVKYTAEYRHFFLPGFPTSEENIIHLTVKCWLVFFLISYRAKSLRHVLHAALEKPTTAVLAQ